MGAMSKRDYDAAFPETPDVVRHAVFSAFREGRRRERRRRHVTQAAVIAATLVVMLGLGALMRQARLTAKQNALTQNDSLPQASASAAPLQATDAPTATAAPTETTEAAVTPFATATESITPEPTVSVTTLPPEMENGSAAGMPESSVIYDDGEMVYYLSLDGSQYYHVSEDEALKTTPDAGILTDSRIQAEATGLWACPDCLFDPRQVYLANGGQYYHRVPRCESQAQGVHGCSLYEALLRGYTACPECAAVEEVYVSSYAPTFYHASTSCSAFPSTDAQQAERMPEDQALANGMLPCEACLGASYSVVSASAWQNLVGSGAVCAYRAGNRYHLDSECASTDAEWMLLGQAIRSSLIPCVDCVQGIDVIDRKEGLAGSLTGFYYTEGGIYYHTVSDCSGMRNAIVHTFGLALASGKQPCPVCFPYDASSEESVRRYMMDIFYCCFGAAYPFDADPSQENVQAQNEAGKDYSTFHHEEMNVSLSDMSDGAYIGIYEHAQAEIQLSLWDAQRMQRFVELWRNAEMTAAYEQAFARVNSGSTTDCRLYALTLSASLDERAYMPSLDSCTFYFLMTNPATSFRATVSVEYSIVDQRVNAMNWQYS